MTAGSARRGVRPTAGAAHGRNVSAWVVRTIILATTAFALLDLSLLVSGLRR